MASTKASIQFTCIAAVPQFGWDVVEKLDEEGRKIEDVALLKELVVAARNMSKVLRVEDIVHTLKSVVKTILQADESEVFLFVGSRLVCGERVATLGKGLTGTMVVSGEPVLRNDFRKVCSVVGHGLNYSLSSLYVIM